MINGLIHFYGMKKREVSMCRSVMRNLRENNWSCAMLRFILVWEYSHQVSIFTCKAFLVLLCHFFLRITVKDNRKLNQFCWRACTYWDLWQISRENETQGNWQAENKAMESKKEVEVELEEIATVEEDKGKENVEKEDKEKQETKGKMFHQIFYL